MQKPAIAHNIKIVTPTDELEVLTQLADTEYFVILKRVVRRLNEIHKEQLRKIKSTDPNLALIHSEYVNKSEGQNELISLIENAKFELARRNKDRI